MSPIRRQCRNLAFLLLPLLAIVFSVLPISPPADTWQPKTAAEFLARGYTRLKDNYAGSMSDAEQALKLQPASSEAKFFHGRVAYEARDYTAAIADFTNIIQQNPDLPEPYHFRGLAYSYSGKYQAAIPDYKKFLQLKPYVAAGYNDIGWTYRELGQFADAKTNLDRAIDLEPDYARARNNRAILFAAEKDWDSAAAELSTLLNLSPKDQWAKDAKDLAERKLPLPPIASAPPVLDRNQPEVPPKLISKTEPEYTEEARRAKVSAIILCSLVVTKEGLPRDIQLVRGAGFGLDENALRAVSTYRFQPATKEGKPAEARANVEVNMRLLNIPNRDGQIDSLNFTLPNGATRPELTNGVIPDNPKEAVNGKLRLAFTVDSNGTPRNLTALESTPGTWAETALRTVEKWRFRPSTLNGQPVDVQAILELNHDLSGNFNLSFPPTSQASGLNPAWEPKSADEFLARGYRRFRTHNYPQAAADAEDALKLAPTSRSALFLHARASYESKEYVTAINDLSKLIESTPDWPETYRYRGLAYSNSGQPERAVQDFQTALKLDPNLPSAYNDLGSAYLALADLDLAEKNIDRAIELEPDLISAHENRVKLFDKERDLPSEQNELALILAIAPNDRWAINQQEALKQRLRHATTNP